MFLQAKTWLVCLTRSKLSPRRDRDRPGARGFGFGGGDSQETAASTYPVPQGGDFVAAVGRLEFHTRDAKGVPPCCFPLFSGHQVETRVSTPGVFFFLCDHCPRDCDWVH